MFAVYLFYAAAAAALSNHRGQGIFLLFKKTKNFTKKKNSSMHDRTQASAADYPEEAFWVPPAMRGGGGFSKDKP